MQASLKILLLLHLGFTIAGMTVTKRDSGRSCLLAVLLPVMQSRTKKSPSSAMSTTKGRNLLGFVALREPSRLITTSELSIMSMLCPDRMLPSRSGTGAASTTAPDWGTPIPLLQDYIVSVTTRSKSSSLHKCFSVLYFVINEHVKTKRVQVQMKAASSMNPKLPGKACSDGSSYRLMRTQSRARDSSSFGLQ